MKQLPKEVLEEAIAAIANVVQLPEAYEGKHGYMAMFAGEHVCFVAHADADVVVKATALIDAHLALALQRTVETVRARISDEFAQLVKSEPMGSA